MCTQGKELIEDWTKNNLSYDRAAERLRGINKIGVSASSSVKGGVARMYRWALVSNMNEFAAAAVAFEKACRTDGF